MTPLAARWRIVGAALLFSTGGAAVKACSLSGWQVAGLRSGIAALALLAFVPASRAAVTRRSWLLGIPYATTLVAFVIANKLTTSANAIFLQSAAPLYIMVLAPWLLDERPRPRDLAHMVALLAGLVMFFVATPAAIASAPHPLQGNLVATGSGVAWALTLLGLRFAGRGGSGEGVASVVAGNTLAFLGCLPFMLPLVMPGPRDALILLYLGAFQIAGSYALLTSALRVVPAFEASLLLLVEPMVNPFFSWWVHGERPDGWSLAGSLTILGATVVKSWVDLRESRRRAAQAPDRAPA